jgi:hypothetical protein
VNIREGSKNKRNGNVSPAFSFSNELSDLNFRFVVWWVVVSCILIRPYQLFGVS